jgi:peptide/nickel transport system substrate-binding protein
MYTSFRKKFIGVLDAFSLSESLLFVVTITIAIVMTLVITYKVSTSFMIEVAKDGGTHVEGFVGAPRSIHPLFAVTDTDRDLTSLVYSGLTRVTIDGKFIPDLAESFSVSDDGKIYTFVIREDAVFHDNTPVTADDIVYTITSAQDPEYKSPKRSLWEGVTVEAVGPKEVSFTLRQPYAGFLANTTLGIVPKHLWSGIAPDEISFSALNIYPVGSGPYKVKSVIRNESGLPKTITFKTFNKFTLGKPHITTFVGHFYANEKARLDALTNGDIDAAGGIDENVASDLMNKGGEIFSSPLNRIFGIFLNQNNAPVLAHKEIRQALSQAIDRTALVAEIFKGYGTELTGPVPPFVGTTTATSSPVDINTILATLEKAGWKVGTDGILTKKAEKAVFSISTSDNTDLTRTAELVAEMWKKIGVQVEVKSFEPAQFNLNVLRPRDYQGLLFGITMGRDLDYYAFWHSSQRNDPGLNIALYTNAKADKLLESARTQTNVDQRIESQRNFALEVRTDVPTIFLYAPYYIYAGKDIKGFDIKGLRTPGDRFYDIYTWYVEVDRVWNFLVN